MERSTNEPKERSLNSNTNEDEKSKETKQTEKGFYSLLYLYKQKNVAINLKGRVSNSFYIRSVYKIYLQEYSLWCYTSKNDLNQQ